MFGAKKHLHIPLPLHRQLDKAVWYNLYTGLAYGTPPSLLLPPYLFCATHARSSILLGI